ncbi:alpha/beta hydrolase-fold protein [Draconibacterium sp.]|nr:alpha/beta hydrolase-fold protein [Draconibacterium sp.]
MKAKKNTSSIHIIFLFTILLLSITTNLYAQQSVELKQSGDVTIKSKILNEERTISIDLPGNYNFTDQKFPILYLLDGKGNFEHTLGAVNYLASRDYIPQTIVIAIHNIDRTRDFSPVHVERFPASGKGEQFLDFISQELIPYMKKNYRISDFSVIMGHSLGGTFITYSLLKKPDLFDGYIAISPYLQYGDKYVIEKAKTELRSNYKSQKYYYMTVGDEDSYFSPLAEFSSLIKEKSGNTISFKYEKLENENHFTTPYLGMFKGLRFIFSDWQMPRETYNKGLVAIDKHFKNLSHKYGYNVSAPENIINMLGYNYMQNEEWDKAIEVFKENTRRYAYSANVYDSLGEAYESNHQLKEAQKNYQKAYDLGKEQNHANTPVYHKNLERVKKKIK